VGSGGAGGRRPNCPDGQEPGQGPAPAPPEEGDNGPEVAYGDDHGGANTTLFIVIRAVAAAVVVIGGGAFLLLRRGS